MDTRQDSATDALRKVYINLAQAKLSPDANGPAGQFIDAMMGAIQKFLVTAATATIGGAGGGPGGGMGQMGGGPPGAAQGGPMGGPAGGGGMPAAPPQQMGAGGGGGMVGLTPSPGSMDEMRRMLTAGSVNP